MKLQQSHVLTTHANYLDTTSHTLATTTTTSPLRVLICQSSSRNLFGGFVTLPDDVLLTSDCSEMFSFRVSGDPITSSAGWCESVEFCSVCTFSSSGIATSCLLFLLKVLPDSVLTLYDLVPASDCTKLFLPILDVYSASMGRQIPVAVIGLREATHVGHLQNQPYYVQSQPAAAPQGEIQRQPCVGCDSGVYGSAETNLLYSICYKKHISVAAGYNPSQGLKCRSPGCQQQGLTSKDECYVYKVITLLLNGRLLHIANCIVNL